jgi:hypothetical protein
MTNEQTAIMLQGYLTELNEVWKYLKKMPVSMPYDGEVEGAQEVFDRIKSVRAGLQYDIDLLKGINSVFTSED